MDGRHHRDRLLGDVDIGEVVADLRIRWAGASMMSSRPGASGRGACSLCWGRSPGLPWFPGHAARHHVARCQVFQRRCVALHETLAPPFLRVPPSPRQPSVSRTPEPATRVGWNCRNSMSSSGMPPAPPWPGRRQRNWQRSAALSCKKQPLIIHQPHTSTTQKGKHHGKNYSYYRRF